MRVFRVYFEFKLTNLAYIFKYNMTDFSLLVQIDHLNINIYNDIIYILRRKKL